MILGFAEVPPGFPGAVSADHGVLRVRMPRPGLCAVVIALFHGIDVLAQIPMVQVFHDVKIVRSYSSTGR